MTSAAPNERGRQPPLAAAYGGETYYDRPAVKRSPWKHEVAAYLFVSGLAGAAQVLAAIAQAVSPARSRTLVRSARFIATAGALSGAGFLVMDLRTKRRWYNMLRIFRATSPMSIGTYVLSSFGLFTGVTLLGELLGGRGRLGCTAAKAADLAQIPAAVAGAGMATYTAALFSSTSTPGWASVPRQLGVQFATSAMASAAAALSLCERAGGSERNARALDDVAALATAAHLAASLAADVRRKSTGVLEPPGQSPSAKHRDMADLVIAGVLPLALYGLARLAGSRSRDVAALAAGAVLVGNYLSRMATLDSGNESADSPRDYFRMSRARNLPALESGDRVRTTLRPTE